MSFVLDVDGVMTDGKLYYSEAGKVMKAFGPDDHDALSLLKPYLPIHFVTGDSRGFNIAKARICDDMQMPLDLVSTVKRLDWIAERWDPRMVVYMGDGIFDHYVFREVGYAVAPANADRLAHDAADYVTKRCGGDRAVAEASLHLLENFFGPFDRDLPLPLGMPFSAKWSA